MIPGIHQAAPIEIPVIQSLIHRIWKPTYKAILTEAQMNYMLERMYDEDTLLRQMEEGHVFLILTEDRSPVGFAGLEYNYPEHGTCKLHKIYLLPETQGKGLGKMLLHAVKETAMAHEQQCLLLNVNRYNKAQDFYISQGFTVIAEEDIDIGQGYFMNDYIMALQLHSDIPS